MKGMVIKMNDTIAAVSTPFGRGGIAVIRISGTDAVSVAEKVFIPFSGKKISEYAANKAVYGSIVKCGRTIDDGICTLFKAPHSYTGEDVVEISCHGGILLTERVLEAVFEAGARQAGAGEFTRRAFTAGKLSLTQAEAVGMLIDAENDDQITLAAAQERGIFKKKADMLYETLKNIVTGVYANIDFPDEDLAELSESELINELNTLKGELENLHSSYDGVRAVTEGIKTVIIGKPNTGKSSLLNRLVGRDRAIVTNVAGTTRDTLEETVQFGRVRLRLVDTAGIHETDDEVERLGVDRSLNALNEAELILAVFDASNELDDEDKKLINLINKLPSAKIAVLNKSDIGKNISSPLDEYVYISAKTGDGTEDLKKRVEEVFTIGDIDTLASNAVVLSARQNASVTRALEYVSSALDLLCSGMSHDTVGLELESALSELSELDGRRVTEEIVDGIFHRFCVGK